MSISLTQGGAASRVPHVPTVDEGGVDGSELMLAFQGSLEREQGLRTEMNELTQRHAMLAQEQAHRFANGIQFIVSTLERQSRLAQVPETKEQLRSASIRILALHRIQRHIYECAQHDTVAFNEFLRKFCEDLSLLLCPVGEGRVIVFEGAALNIPSTTAIPLVLSVNELITNAAKYAAGKVTVRIECDPRSGRHVSVTDDGPGLPVGFEPKSGEGLGMKIVSALVGQIGGELHFAPGPGGQGACCTISF